MQTYKALKAGFTLVEIMIVVAIIGMLAAVAIPSLSKARKNAQREACKMNLKTIEGAKQLWATENKKGENDTPTDADLFGPDRTIKKKPECPGGGTYDIRPVSQYPACSIPDHTIE